MEKPIRSDYRFVKHDGITNSCLNCDLYKDGECILGYFKEYVEKDIKDTDFDCETVYGYFEKIKGSGETALKKSDPLDILLEWIKEHQEEVDINNMGDDSVVIYADTLIEKINELKTK